MKFQDIIIDKEFQLLIPALATEELRQLQANIEADGFRDKIVVWNGILLDGHNRHDIAINVAGIGKPEILEIELPSREAALIWIHRNQLGRRNLPEAQQKFLIGSLYNLEKSEAKKNLKRGDQSPKRNSCASGETSGKQQKEGGDKKDQPTADRIANDVGISPRTVQADGAYASALEQIRGVNDKFVAAVLQGNVKVSQAAIIKIGKLDGRGIRAALGKLREGKNPFEPAPKKDEPPKPKTKAPRNEFGKQVDADFGVLVRSLDSFGKAVGEHNNNRHEACLSSLNEFQADWNNWKESK